MVKHRLALLALLTLGLLKQAAPYTVPTSLQSGVYEITFDPESQVQPQTHIFHYAIDPYTNVTATTDHAHPVPPKKQVLACNATEGDGLDGRDLDLARRMLENWCEGHGIHRRAIVLAVHNDAAWYMCSFVYHYYRKKYEVCGRREVLYSAQTMDEGCGKDKAASMVYWHLRKYGRTRLGRDICDDWGLHQEVLMRNESTTPFDGE
ncbi:hypothetical protein E4U53_005185 [Claviceps sorghi]|nr:hypothetical protein E4U53_005185 [Claviceps sorghi]